jgi:dihydrofolate reductase
MKLIIACDPNGGIGLNNQLPWDRLDGDLTRFKHLTKEGVVIMGRNTWESLPKKPLPNRLNFVVTSASVLEGAITIKSLAPLENYSSAWIIGGAKLINSSWQFIDQVHLSRTHVQYHCDTFIDLLYLDTNYNRVHIEHFNDHTYEIWEKNEKLS